MKIKVKKKEFILEIIYLVVLIALLIVNYHILVQPVKVNRVYVSQNKTIPVLTNVDGYWYYRLLTYIYTQGTVPFNDTLRAYPKGALYYRVWNFITFNMQYLTLPLILIYGSPWYAAIYAPVIYSLVTSLLIYFFIRRVTKKRLVALVAAVMFIFTSISLYRFSAGFYDHDIFCCMYLIICLWCAYEILFEIKFEKNKRSILKIIFVSLMLLIWYAAFINSSATYRALFVILSGMLILLVLAKIQIEWKNLLLLVVLLLLSACLVSPFAHLKLKYLYLYLTDFATIIFYIGVTVYAFFTYFFINLYERKIKQFVHLDFSEVYFIFLIALTILAWWAAFNIPALKSKIVVIKQVGIARTIAEWKPLIDWNLFFKEPLVAIAGMINRLAYYYSPMTDSYHIMFWIGFVNIILFLILYIIDCITKKIKLFTSKGLIYYFLVSFMYFILAIIVGVQGIRLLSLFPPAISFAFSLVFVFVDEESIVSLFTEPLEKIRSSVILKAILSLALVSLFVGVYVYYAINSYNFLQHVWLAAINQVWYNAMKWIAENTPKSSVFDFWWDYGYWVQTIGQRATVTDGAHASPIPNFDYYNAYYTFLGDLNTSYHFMKKFGVTHFLVSWEEIGKWGAISYNAEYFANTYLHKNVHYFSSIIPCVMIGSEKNISSFACLVGNSILKVNVKGKLSKPSSVELILPTELGEVKYNVSYYGVSASSGLIPTVIKLNVTNKLPVMFIVSGAAYEFNENIARYLLAGALYERNYIGGYLIVSNYGINDNLFDIDKIANSTFVKLFLIGENTKYYHCVYSCNIYPIPILFRDKIIGFFPVVKIWALA